MLGKRVSEYLNFQRAVLLAILVVGLARLLLSLAGLPNSSVKWFSLTGMSVVGALWAGFAVARKGFGGYRELLGLILTQQVLVQGLIIFGIVVGIIMGRDNIFTAGEYTNTAVVAEGRSWAHTVGHFFAILVGSAVLWVIGSLALFATRRAGGARKALSKPEDTRI